jgi:hypothetical protein
MVGAMMLTACVQTRVTLLRPEMRLAPICPEGVAVFLAADRVGQPYTELALLESTGDNAMTSEAGMYESQRKKAADIGANGLVLGPTRDANTAAQIAQTLIGTPANRRGRAIAIHIPADTARVTQACAGRMPGDPDGRSSAGAAT